MPHDYTTYKALPEYVNYVFTGPNKPDPPGLKWSGKAPPPAIGETINVRMNGIGPMRVNAYFSECGWLGVIGRVLSPPPWWIKQNGAKRTAHIFGTEISEVEK